VAVALTGPSPRLSLYAVWRTGDTSPVVEAFLASLAAAGPFTWREPGTDTPSGRLTPAS
jgi:hypothetical protein